MQCIIRLHHQKPEDIELIDSNPGAVVQTHTIWLLMVLKLVADPFVFLINNYNHACLICLVSRKEEAQAQFGFLMNAFEFVRLHMADWHWF